MTDVPPLLRRLLAEAFPDSPRLVAIFEDLALALIEAKDTAEAAASGEVQAAHVVLSLPSEAFASGRVLTQGAGIDIEDAAGLVTVSVSDEVPLVEGGYPVRFIATGETNLILPTVGQVATIQDIGTVVGAYQPLDGTLTALAGLNAAAGLVEQTGADAFTKRAIGTATAASILTRGDGDGRYVLQTTYTAADVLAKLLTVDGAGTNLDADLLDGLNSTAFILASALDTDGTLAANSDAKIPSQKATKTYVDALLGAQDAMVFKGVIDASANPNYPAADKGHTYRISVAGKIGGASGPKVEAGDILLAITDGSAAGNHATVGANWSIIQVNIDGAVIGPASATDNAFVRFDGATGKLVKNGATTINLATEASGILGSALGGTGNGFTKFSGPAASEKTFTLPNASDTIACLGQAQSFSAAQTFLNSSGIKILDTDASHTFGIVGGSNLTANRTLTLTLGDANRTLTMTGDASITGTNTGDQITIVGITSTKAQFDTAVTDGNFLYVGDITQYTDEMAQDAVGGILIDSASIDFTYDDAANTITAIVKDSSITYAKMQNVSATDKVLGRKTAGAGVVEEIAFSSVARTMVGQTTQLDMRSTGLGLGTMSTQDAVAVAITGGSATGLSVVRAAGVQATGDLPAGAGPTSFQDYNTASSAGRVGNLNLTTFAWGLFHVMGNPVVLFHNGTAMARTTTSGFQVDGLLAVGGAGSFGGATGSCLFMANATAVPSSNPVGGGLFYVEAGAFKFRGSGGTVTTIAAA